MGYCHEDGPMRSSGLDGLGVKRSIDCLEAVILDSSVATSRTIANAPLYLVWDLSLDELGSYGGDVFSRSLDMSSDISYIDAHLP